MQAEQEAKSESYRLSLALVWNTNPMMSYRKSLRWQKAHT